MAKPEKVEFAEIHKYVGELNIQDGSFEATAEQFIVRLDSVGFTFAGLEDGKRGKFSVQGTAEKRPDGSFHCSQIPLRYTQGEMVMTDLTFTLKQVQKSGRWVCMVLNGRWKDASGIYLFDGELSEKSALQGG